MLLVLTLSLTFAPVDSWVEVCSAHACFSQILVFFCVCSPSSARTQTLLYLFCTVAALGSWQETEFTSEGLNEESLMTGLLQTCGLCYRKNKEVVQVPGTNSKGDAIAQAEGTRGTDGRVQ